MTLLRTFPNESNTKEIRTVNIGIDFGTNSTKVIYQIVESTSNENAYIYDFNSNFSVFPPYSFPSIVVLDSNKFYFGDEAYLRKDRANAIFSSFKMCLACFKNIIECKDCNSQGISSFSKGTCEINHRKINAAVISLLYLAYVIGKVANFLKHRYKGQFDLNFYYNISFPLEFLGTQRKFFGGIAHYAERLKDDVYQGISIDDVIQILKEAKKKITPHISNENKIVYVIEETRAAMHSFIKSGYLPEGLYAIVDIGASTTDISFFRYAGANQPDPFFAFYADQSHTLGGDDFDRIIMTRIRKIRKNTRDTFTSKMLYEIRQAKHDLVNNKAKFNLPHLDILWSFNEIEKMCRELLNTLHQHFSMTLREKAIEKEKALERWKNLNIILIGGGSEWRNLSNTFLRPPFFGNQVKWEPTFPTPAIPDNLNTENAIINTNELRKNFLYFYVAHGLSYFHQDVTEFYSPEEVPDFEPPQIIVEKLDRDELYPK